MYYIFWFVGVLAVCFLSVLIGVLYERKHGDDE